jgi:hypothetical protein
MMRLLKSAHDKHATHERDSIALPPRKRIARKIFNLIVTSPGNAMFETNQYIQQHDAQPAGQIQSGLPHHDPAPVYYSASASAAHLIIRSTRTPHRIGGRQLV